MVKYDFSITKEKLSNDTVHGRIINLIRENSLVLDIGCSTGYIAKYLKENKNCKVIGIEKNEEAALIAQKYCYKVLVGDIQKESIFENIKEKFDFIIIADVLEHLLEPQKVLIKIKKYLRENGNLIISLPNVAYWKIRVDLMFGRFNYTEKGILDRTHVKFFTFKTAKNLLLASGFKIKYVIAVDGFGFSFMRKIYPELFAAQMVFLMSLK